MSTGQIVGGIIGAVVGFFTPVGPIVSANSMIGIGEIVPTEEKSA